MDNGLNRAAIQARIQAFLSEEGLYLDQITLHHGAALVMHGLRKTTNDIDMEVPSDVFVRLREKYAPGMIPLKFHDDLDFHHPQQFIPYLAHECFEIFQEGSGRVELIDDYAVYTVDTILLAKQAMNRKKDQETIRRLQMYLDNVYVTQLSA